MQSVSKDNNTILHSFSLHTLDTLVLLNIMLFDSNHV